MLGSGESEYLSPKPLVYGAVGVAVISTITATAVALYRSIRPRFPVKVNCWFCNEDTEVPYGNKECWDCPKCEQYNGFTEDGDYNKSIPSQFVEEFNHLVTPDRSPESFQSTSDVLCHRCQTNQLLKIKQLANFSPVSELTYDAELRSYKARMEQTYPLCRRCNEKVSDVIGRQDKRLRKKLIKEGLDPDRTVASDSFNSSLGDANRSADMSLPQALPSTLSAKLLQVGCVLVTLLLCLVCVDHAVSRCVHWDSEPAQEIWLTRAIRNLYGFVTELTALAFVCTVVMMYRNQRQRLRLQGVLVCCSWTSLLVTSLVLRGQTVTYGYLPLTQVGLSLASLVSLLWWLLGNKPEGRVIRINTKKSRLSFGASSLSSSDISRPNSPTPPVVDDDDRSSVMSDEDGCFSDFETMSLGALPLRKRNRPRHRPDIFSAYSAGLSTTTSHHSLQESPTSTSPFHQTQHSPVSLQINLGRRKPLISPARFKHRSAPTRSTVEYSVSPSHGRALNAGGIGLGTSRNSLFRNHPWSGPFSQVSDDVASLFSEHRQPKEIDIERISHHSGSRSSGSVCPVGTTFNDPEPQLSVPASIESSQAVTEPRTKHWSRHILAISVLLNMMLFAYFVIDLPKALDNVCFLILNGLGCLERFLKGFRMQLNIKDNIKEVDHIDADVH